MSHEEQYLTEWCQSDVTENVVKQIVVRNDDVPSGSSIEPASALQST